MILKQLIIFLVVIIPTSALAGAYQGKITRVFGHYNKVFIKLEGGSASGNCGAGDSFSIDPSTDYGKALISIALTAKTTGRVVWAGGNGICEARSPLGGSEILVALDFKG